MGLKLKIFALLILILGITTITFSAIEIEGILNQATQNYIVINGHKYVVTKSTIIKDLRIPQKKIFYSLHSLPVNCLVRIKIEKGIVKEIIIVGVPK